MRRNHTTKRRQFGQGMSEYIIITALIAVAGIGVFAAFGDTLTHQMAAMSMEMSGQSGDAERNDARGSAAVADQRANNAETLSNYVESN